MTEEHSDKDTIRYLMSVGMRQKDAEAWIKARKEGKSFMSGPHDGVGRRMDNLWKSGLDHSAWGKDMRDIILAARDLKGAATGKVPARELRKYATWRTLVALLALYSFVMWVYVISFQIVVPESVYWPLALWLPIRMDYFGEASLVSSFIFAVLWVKLR